MRYVGQNFELAVPVADSDDMRKTRFRIAPDTLAASFFEAHDRAYGYHNPDDPVEVVNFRLTALGRLSRPVMESADTGDGAPTPIGTRSDYFEPDHADVADIYHRADFKPGHRITGPAVVEQLDSTVLVYPGDNAFVDDAYNLNIELAS